MTNTSYKRILHERNVAFTSQDKRGQSKHAEKLANRCRAELTGEPYEQPHGIFSNGTYDCYKKQTTYFINFIRDKGFDVKHLSDCIKYVDDYFNEMIDKELSAWTVHTRVFALATAFQCKVDDFYLCLPKRCRSDIKRTRQTTKTDLRFISAKYANIKKFAVATGARRGGILKLKTNDLLIKPGGDVLIHLDEKGGKERWALVLPKYAEFVKQIFEASPGYGPEGNYLFQKDFPPKSMAIHECRSIYAQNLYRLFDERGFASGKKYICRRDMHGKIFDRNLLLVVSRNMGHNRLDVIPGPLLFYPVDWDAQAQKHRSHRRKGW